MTASDRSRPTRAAGTARERARRELTRDLIAVARDQLAIVGPTALSLRAVARDLGLASSAVYRYVGSRDELLTLLIVEAYNDLGEAAEQADRSVDRGELIERWRAVCRAVRAWAMSNPHEHALIFGSPVPGYAAPEVTIGPAQRAPRVLIGLLVDSAEHGHEHGVQPGSAGGVDGIGLTPSARRAMAPLRAEVPEIVPDDLLARGFMSWTLLIGLISFELFGHTVNVIDDDPGLRLAWFDDQIDRAAALVGLDVRS